MSKRARKEHMAALAHVRKRQNVLESNYKALPTQRSISFNREAKVSVAEHMSATTLTTTKPLVFQPKVVNVSAKASKPLFPLDALPLALLMITLEHLPLKDFFVARYINKHYHNLVHRLLIRRAQLMPREHLKHALGRSNLFYDALCHLRFKQVWCCGCAQLKQKNAFAQDGIARRLGDDYYTFVRFCWQCRRTGNNIFVFSGEGRFFCTNSISCGDEKVDDGVWMLNGKKFCLLCWPENVNTPSGRYVFCCDQPGHHIRIVEKERDMEDMLDECCDVDHISDAQKKRTLRNMTSKKKR